jgi:hypothetical protein
VVVARRLLPGAAYGFGSAPGDIAAFKRRHFV